MERNVINIIITTMGSIAAIIVFILLLVDNSKRATLEDQIQDSCEEEAIPEICKAGTYHFEQNNWLHGLCWCEKHDGTQLGFRPKLRGEE